MLNAVLRRGGEVLATALVVAFVSLRCMELIDVYCQSRLHLVLHAGLGLLAALPGETLLLARTVRRAPKSLRISESSASSTTQCDSSVDTMPTCRCASRREMAAIQGGYAPQGCAPDPCCCTYCSSPKAWREVLAPAWLRVSDAAATH